MPYLITPDKRMSMGEVYTAKFEAGKVFCIEVYDSASLPRHGLQTKITAL